MRFVLVGLSLLAALPLAAQERVPTAQDSVRANLAIAQSDLRNLVVAQEVYFSQRGQYAPHLDSLKGQYVPSRGSTLRLTVAHNNRWGASLARQRLSGSCVIYVGLRQAERPKTDGQGLTPAEGEPVCDPQPELQTAAPTLVRPPMH